MRPTSRTAWLVLAKKEEKAPALTTYTVVTVERGQASENPTHAILLVNPCTDYRASQIHGTSSHQILGIGTLRVVQHRGMLPMSRLKAETAIANPTQSGRFSKEIGSLFLTFFGSYIYQIYARICRAELKIGACSIT
jgi:hypothetical protein